MFGLAVLELPRNVTKLCRDVRNGTYAFIQFFVRNQIVGEIGTMLVPFSMIICIL